MALCYWLLVLIRLRISASNPRIRGTVLGRHSSAAASAGRDNAWSAVAAAWFESSVYGDWLSSELDRRPRVAYLGWSSPDVRISGNYVVWRRDEDDLLSLVMELVRRHDQDKKVIGARWTQ